MHVASQVDVEQIRREARATAARAGFGRADAEMIVLAVAELATNLLRYAIGGHISVQTVSRAGVLGVVVVSHDGGPGIDDVERALQDGYSTGGGMGSGLPAVRRLMDDFALTTGPAGTRIEAYKWTSAPSQLP